MRFISLAYVVGSLISSSTALQVTPNSPCASVCVNPNDNITNANSFGTTNADITCLDSDYQATAVGQSFERCLSCLQSSTYSQGAESDQLWFLYNLRYAFDNCVFGFPNATTISSSPCSTSFACGDLMPGLTQGDLDPNSPAYSYCSVDGSDLSAASTSVQKCMQCVAATDGESYLVNFLIALQAGCDQQPAPGVAIGLNGTVFSTTQISATNSSEDSSDSGGVQLSTAAVIGIIVGVLAVVFSIAAVIFICYRKRRNRRVLLEDSGRRRRHHRPGSSLSFRCQTHLTPHSAAFPNTISESTIEEAEEEKAYTSPHMALGSHPYASASPISKQSVVDWPSSTSKSEISSFSRPGAAPRTLKSINTTGPTIPSSVHYSTSPKASLFSPSDQTPVSTTSTSQLLPLRAYNPADYGVGSPNLGSSTDGSYTSPTSGTTASPLLSRVWDQNQKQNGRAMSPVWEQPHRELDIGRATASLPRVAGTLERMGVPPSPGKGRRVSNTGSPVETHEINIHFAAPPSRR